MASPSTVPALRLSDIEAARHLLGDRVRLTPVHEWTGPTVDALGAGTRVFLKLELFQHTGSFKPRGVLLNLLNLPRDDLKRGVTAVSAGNHAVAVSYGARVMGTTAKLVVIKTASPMRVELCRYYGAEVVFAEDAHAAFERAAEIELEERRPLIHPFEGLGTATGTATVGYELATQVPDLDFAVVPIGGGGLCAGVASALKIMQPRCRVIGVEPEGADSMHRSFAAGGPRSIDKVRTIADSLGAPYALPISFELCRRNVDELVLVSDLELRGAMRTIQREAKLAVEPAGAAATAALLGPLRARTAGKRVALIVCGANIDAPTYARLIAEDAPTEQR
ncbi:MAG TPA: threonine/serine dehydratase [Steroidobacteraceae bacterium]|nr:threonine/serine dehydratase [Steroidobacteraceae bacterium]